MIFELIARSLISNVVCRQPDFIVGGRERPYLKRWWVIPRNPILNVFVHQFLRSDDDRALHDHPWASLSIILSGGYTEHTIAAGGINHRRVLAVGDWRARLTGRFAHRVELHDGPCWTLFVTGPRYRSWGFHCPERGWVHWEEFTAPHDKGEIGKGCER